MAFTYAHTWTLDATPGRVFHALTEPDELRAWFAEDVQVEPHAGGVYRFWGRHTPGTPPREDARQTVTRFEAGYVLAFAWPMFEVDTDVTLALAPTRKGTRLSVTHDVSASLPVPHSRELIATFWQRAIANLAAHLGGQAPAMPDYFVEGGGR